MTAPTPGAATGATWGDIEAALVIRDAEIGYRCRCEICLRQADEWARAFVPPTHRIVPVVNIPSAETIAAIRAMNTRKVFEMKARADQQLIDAYLAGVIE